MIDILFLVLVQNYCNSLSDCYSQINSIYLVSSMLPYHKGFTLIEVIITTMIIAIVLGISLNLSHHQLDSIRSRIAVEHFATAYQSVVSRSMTTTTPLALHRDTTSWRNWMSVSDPRVSLPDLDRLTLQSITRDGQILLSLDIVFQSLGCTIQWLQTGDVAVSLWSQDTRSSLCFRITLPICKLLPVSCPLS